MSFFSGYIYRQIWLLAGVLLFSFGTLACAQEHTPQNLEVPLVETPPAIDGKLDDACWLQAVRVEGFFCLDVATELPSPEDTVALFCQSDTALYLAVICNDSSPQDIVANETRRGGDVSKDDSVKLRLDTWHTHGEFDCYEFSVNAAGTQAEDIPGGSATKIEWRGDWRAAATRTPAGWQAEMEIPFSILRYGVSQEVFGFAVTRHLNAENLNVCFPNTGRVFDHSRTGNLVGLRLPGAEQKTILMPYVTADFGEYVGRRYDAGLDIQHKLPNGMTALASLNPDFKQIEDVVEPISFSYTEKQLSDPRPFFVTGQGGFLPGDDLLYTRRIEDFDAGLKLFGKVGDETLGLLDVTTFGEENAFAAAWDHRFGDNASAKLSVVNHSKENQPGNIAYSLGGSRFWRNPEGYKGFWGSASQSETYGGATGQSFDFGGEVFGGPGKFQGWFDWRWVSEDYYPALGYAPDVNYQGVSLGFGLTDRYENGAIEEKGWYVSGAYRPYLEDGDIYSAYLSPSYRWEWRNGRRLRIGFTNGRREDSDSSDGSVSYSWNRKDIYRQGGIYLLVGNRRGGDYTYLSLDQGFKPSERVTLSLNCEYSDLGEPAPDAQYDYLVLLTGTYDLTDEKSVSARLIQRKEGFTAYASYRQVVRQGMDMYIILGDPNPEKTGFTERLVVKLIWAL